MGDAQVCKESLNMQEQSAHFIYHEDKQRHAGKDTECDSPSTQLERIEKCELMCKR